MNYALLFIDADSHCVLTSPWNIKRCLYLKIWNGFVLMELNVRTNDQQAVDIWNTDTLT